MKTRSQTKDSPINHIALPIRKRAYTKRPPQPPSAAPRAPTIVISGSDDSTIRIWTIATGLCEATLCGHAAYVKALAITPDGRLIVSAGYDRTVRIWDRETHQCLRVVAIQSDVCSNALAMAPDGKRVYCEYGESSVCAIDVATGEIVWRRGIDGDRVQSIVVTPDGKTLVAGMYDHMIAWDLATGLRRFFIDRINMRVRFMRVTPDSKHIVYSTLCRTVYIVNAATGEQERTIDVPASIEALGMTPDGKSLIIACENEWIHMWGLGPGAPYEIGTENRQAAGILSVTIPAPGGIMFTGSRDGGVRKWNIDNTLQWRCTLTGHKDWVRTLIAW